jgi:hypothetical protein
MNNAQLAANIAHYGLRLLDNGNAVDQAASLFKTAEAVKHGATIAYSVREHFPKDQWNSVTDSLYKFAFLSPQEYMNRLSMIDPNTGLSQLDTILDLQDKNAKLRRQQAQYNFDVTNPEYIKTNKILAANEAQLRQATNYIGGKPTDQGIRKFINNWVGDQRNWFGGKVKRESLTQQLNKFVQDEGVRRGTAIHDYQAEQAQAAEQQARQARRQARRQQQQQMGAGAPGGRPAPPPPPGFQGQGQGTTQRRQTQRTQAPPVQPGAPPANPSWTQQINQSLRNNPFVRSQIVGLKKDWRMMQRGNVLGGAARMGGRAAVPLAALTGIGMLGSHLLGIGGGGEGGGREQTYQRPARQRFDRIGSDDGGRARYNSGWR